MKKTDKWLQERHLRRCEKASARKRNRTTRGGGTSSVEEEDTALGWLGQQVRRLISRQRTDKAPRRIHRTQNR